MAKLHSVECGMAFRQPIANLGWWADGLPLARLRGESNRPSREEDRKETDLTTPRAVPASFTTSLLLILPRLAPCSSVLHRIVPWHIKGVNRTDRRTGKETHWSLGRGRPQGTWNSLPRCAEGDIWWWERQRHCGKVCEDRAEARKERLRGRRRPSDQGILSATQEWLWM